MSLRRQGNLKGSTSISMLEQGYITFIWLLIFPVVFLAGCTSTLHLQPTLPPSTSSSVSPARIGVYITNTPKDEIPAKSGIWPGTTYHYAADETVQEGLMQLTKRHFRNAGIAENAGDKRWDYVLEYTCEQPYVDGATLRSQVPLKSTLRNPQTGREVQSITLTGEGPAQDGRFMRFVFGRFAEKHALEKSLTDAYNNLFGSVEGNLARLGTEQSRTAPGKPYRKKDHPSD